MKKKGLSGIIANVLLVLLTISLISVVGFFAIKFAKQDPFEKQSSFNCVTNANIMILSACYEGNLLKINVKNNREIMLGDFFLVEVSYIDSRVEEIPTPYHTYVKGYETKQIVIPYLAEISKIKVIPKIEAQAYLCSNNAPVFEGIKECS